MAARSHLPRVDAFRLALLVGLAFTALHALDAFDPGGDGEVPLVSRMEHAAQDFALTRLRGPRAASGDVVVVAVDERSIRAEGRWPWSLGRMGRLVDGLARGGARAVGFDVVWAEEDEAGRRLAEVAREARSAREAVRDPGASRLLDRVLALAGDPLSPGGVAPVEQLAGAIERARNVTVGFMFLGPRDAPPLDLAAGVERLGFLRTAPVRVADGSGRLVPAPPDAGGAPRAVGHRFAGALPPLGAILAVADAGGFFNVLPDADGTLRRYLTVAQACGATFPSLGVAVLAKAAATEGVAAAVVPVGGESGDRVAAVRIGPWTVETGPDGGVPLGYLGHYRDFPTVSATDVMSGSLPDGALRGKIAVVGNTAAGTWDQRVTPFDDFAPGVVVHATFVENVLHGGLLRRGTSVVLGETLAMAALALGLAFLFSRVSSAAAVPALVLALGAWTGLSIVLLRRFGVLVALGAPLAQVVGMFLAATSQRFLAEDRAKRKARETFGRFLAPAMVEEVLAREGPLELGGEKRDLTVLFCDIRGFTTLSERLDPKVLLEVLNEYLTPMTDIIVSEHSGTLDKYIGDAIMAFWGAPKEVPDHPMLACRAALAMLRRLDELRSRWREAGLPDIDVGIGINTGSMSVGFVGSQDRFYNYTVLGDAVNLASRLEGANKEYGTRILLSQATLERVRGRVVAREVDSVQVRGKREPVVVHELLGLAPAGPEEAALLSEFALGLGAWKGRRWDEAIVHFRAADRLRGGDPCSRAYVARCEAMRLHPPGPEWDGVYEMKTK